VAVNNLPYSTDAQTQVTAIQPHQSVCKTKLQRFHSFLLVHRFTFGWQILKSCVTAVRKISRTKWNVESTTVLSCWVNTITSDERRPGGTDDLGKTSCTHWVKFRTNGANDTSSTVTTTSILKHQQHSSSVLDIGVKVVIPTMFCSFALESYTIQYETVNSETWLLECKLD